MRSYLLFIAFCDEGVFEAADFEKKCLILLLAFFAVELHLFEAFGLFVEALLEVSIALPFP